MNIVERMTKLHDDHSLSGIINQTPNVFVMSADLIGQLDKMIGQGKYFRGCPIREIAGKNTLIVGFEELGNDLVAHKL